MKRITIDSPLSEQFDIPTSTLKRCFKGVFGTNDTSVSKKNVVLIAAKRLLQDSGSVYFRNR